MGVLSNNDSNGHLNKLPPISMTSGCWNLHADDIYLAHYIEEFINFVYFKFVFSVNSIYIQLYMN